ncbi:MAG: xanthine dehydrogenase [Frankiales bacterium]|nr:xanthine dehydrogenase [Frankiales bacterium]
MTAVGQSPVRVDGPDKVTGRARYAAEQPADAPLHGWLVQAEVAVGRVLEVDRTAALAVPGVTRVLDASDAPRLGETEDPELHVLQSAQVSYRGQVVALVLAESLEAAREGARLVRVRYEEQPHDVRLTDHHPHLYAPDHVNPSFATDEGEGDLAAALAGSAHVVDVEYTTPALFNNPMEPHATTARWDGDRLHVHDSTQGTTGVKKDLARLFAVPEAHVRVLAQHVGGGFGSKGSARPNVVLAAMAARVTGRTVKVTLTRSQQFSLVGYRTPTLQRLRLGAGEDGRLTAVGHGAVEQTSTLFEFAEQTSEATRHVYPSDARLTTHRLAALDVPTPRWMRAPGEAPGMFALECAMDELAVATGIDPVELRLRNDTQVDPSTDRPFSSRHLAECLRRGAEVFGWAGRDPRPGVRREGRWLVGTGMATATYPVYIAASSARARRCADGTFEVGVNATDLGTGARTVLRQLAADALGVDPSRVRVDVADSDLPDAPVAGGSSGTSSWGSAVHKACCALVSGRADEVVVDTQDEVDAQAELSRHAFGAQFAEARVDLDSGEVRVPRMVGVFAVGRVVNPRTAASQLRGGMVMGLGMALHEGGDLDLRYGDYANSSLAEYHVPTHADVGDLQVETVDEIDRQLNPVGTKGVGEIGIVGSPAAVLNAVWHATGMRVRELPCTPDRLLAGLPER